MLELTVRKALINIQVSQNSASRSPFVVFVQRCHKCLCDILRMLVHVDIGGAGQSCRKKMMDCRSCFFSRQPIWDEKEQTD